jgi:hypothetical protein
LKTSALMGEAVFQNFTGCSAAREPYCPGFAIFQ